jgi:inorganic pyrophosphatase
MRGERFWDALDELVESSEIVIDRPKGSRHPRYPDCVYPLDYGYLAGTSASDGGGIDVWVGSLPERRIVGVTATVDLVKRDTEIKILIGLTDEEIGIVHEFLNTGPMGAVTIKREG